MNKSIIWWIFAICFIISGCFIDIDFYFGNYLFVLLSICLFVGIFTYMAFNKFNNIFDFVSDPNFDEPERQKGGIGFVVVACFFSVVFVHGFNNFKKGRLFEKNGVLTIGEVVNGFEETNGKGSRKYSVKNQISVKFKDEKGTYQVVEKEISNQAYEKVYLGMSIVLIFCKGHPNFVNLILNSSDIKKYRNVEDRNINIFDLQKIDSIKNETEILKVLNKIALNWIMQNNNGRNVFVNISKDELIFFSDGILNYTKFKNGSPNYLDFLKPLGVIKESNIPKELLEEKEESGNFNSIRSRTLKNAIGLNDINKQIETKKYFVYFVLENELDEKNNFKSIITYSFVKK